MKTSRLKVSTLILAGYGTVCAFLVAAIVLGLGEQAELDSVAYKIANDHWPVKLLALGSLGLQLSGAVAALVTARLWRGLDASRFSFDHARITEDTK